MTPHQSQWWTTFLLWYSCAYLDGTRPAERIIWIVQPLSIASDSERFFRLYHYCQFICGIFSEACLYGSRLGSVMDFSSVEWVRAYFDPSSTSEIAADIGEDLVAVDFVGMGR